MGPGDVIATRFVLEASAGSGGMGIVYRARDRETGAAVAVKTMHSENRLHAERFDREAAVLSGLHHPNIVRYVAHGVSGDGELFLVLEWLEGETLRQHLARSVLSIEKSLRVVRRIAEALSYTHARGVVHRDVKPSNVFVERDGLDRVKLIDFGIARVELATAITREGTFLGTPAYAAPEQLRGDPSVEAGADVYSLGCLLYRCIVGCAPFAGGVASALHARVMLERPPRLRDAMGNVSPALDDLVDRMLSKDPAARPTTGSALLEELSLAADQVEDATHVSSSVPRSAQESGAARRGTDTIGLTGPIAPRGEGRPLLRPGDTFGRYVVLALLGAGGTGRVYRAQDTLLQRPVALKILVPNPAHEAESRARILGEARAAAGLEQRNVVAIFDVGEFDGTPYLAMECVSGQALRRYIGDPSIPIGRRIRWLREIALALAAAHKRGLVHRDVKPENVMVGDDGAVKVVDFGIAEPGAIDPAGPTVEGPVASAHGTAARDAITGTPFYMAPEQLRGEGVDGRADQFAWGVTAYELLSGGARPWDSGRAGGQVADLPGSEPPSLELREPAVPVEVADIVRRALMRPREDRFSSMKEIASALAPHQSHSLPDISLARVPVALPSPSHSAPDEVGVAHQTTRIPVSIPSEALASRASRLRSRPLAVVAVIAGISLLVGLRLAAPSRPGSTGKAAAASSAPGPVTDSALPHSENREAIAAYVQARQAVRDGELAASESLFQRAVEKDPMLGAAYLRMAITQIADKPRLAHESYQHARELRSLLDARDQALLDSAEPYITHTPTDPAEWARRLSALLARFPGDVEISYYLGVARGENGDFDGAKAAAEQTLASDPQFRAATWTLAEAQAYLGEMDTAVKTLEGCLATSPAATQCSYVLDQIHQQRGDYAPLERTAREELASTPGARYAHRDIAEAMLARGAPLEAVRATVDEEVASTTPEARRDRLRLQESFRLEVLAGDFVAAEKAAHELTTLAAKDSAARWHTLAADDLVALYTETDERAKAGEIARAFLAAKEAWEPEARAEDQTIAMDATPRMLAAERRAGLISRETFVAKRAEWIADWGAKASPFYRRYVWLHGYAATVDSEDDAREALEALPRYGAVPPFRPYAQPSVALGWVYLLAGRAGEALPLLESSARTCAALAQPFAQTRAHYLLGRALEGTGDLGPACDEYRAVLARWPNVHPASVTAEQARHRARALDCDGPRARTGTGR